MEMFVFYFRLNNQTKIKIAYFELRMKSNFETKIKIVYFFKIKNEIEI